jgi:hypothetical protein
MFKKYLIISLAFTVYSACSPRATTAQIACDLTTVQNAVNAAAAGSTVTLQACNTTWATNLDLGGKKITLKGAGVGQTVITSTKGTGSPPYLISWAPGASANVAKLSDMTLNSGGPDSSGSGEAIYVTGNATNFIIQNVTIESHRERGITFQGYIRGVLSGVIINNYTFSVPVSIEHGAWLDSWSSDGYGHVSWASDSTLGSTEQIIAEDMQINGFCGGYCPGWDAFAGARYTLRFSKVTNAQVVQHGLDTPTPWRGTMQWEYYRNVLSNTNMGGVSMLPLRGGYGRMFDNYHTTNQGGGVADIWYQRGHQHPPGNLPLFYLYGDCRVRTIESIACTGGVATVTMPAVGADQTSSGFTADVWATISGSSVGNYNGTVKVTGPQHTFQLNRQLQRTFTYNATCGGPATGGTVAVAMDGNTNVGGYACMDGIGRGKGRNYANSALFAGSFPGAANQEVQRSYFFNNKVNGAISGVFASSGVTDPLSGAENQDYYNQDNTNCAPNAGNCALGIGRGTLAQRPASCTNGVGWWATDQGSWNNETAAQHNNHDPSSLTHTLGEDGLQYQCVGGVWQLNYTPPAYPHSLLTGGGGNSPPSLSISSHSGEVNTTAATASIVGTCSDDVGCPVVTYSCAPACGSGNMVGVTNVTLTANLPTGVSTWTFSVTDAGSLTSSVIVKFYRVAAASTLPHVETFAIGAGVTWGNGYGSNWSQVGAPQYGISNQQGVVNTSAYNGLLFTGVPLNASQYIEALVIDVSPLARQIRFCLGASGTSGQTNNFNGYVVQFDGTNSTSNIVGRYDGGALTTNYTTGGLGTVSIVNGATIVGAKKIGNTIQAYTGAYPGTPAGPLVTTAGEYTGGTVGDCSVGVGTRLKNLTVGNAAAPADSTPPTVTIDTPTSGNNYHSTQSSVTVGAAVSDNVGIASCQMTNSQIAGNTPLTPSAGRVSTIVSTTQGNQYTITITCLDAANNQGFDTLLITTDAANNPTVVNSVRGVF